ncbi:MAG: hypothetical protein PHT91_01015 [Candidatus Nanoarchaeia archaeon]|nr:hypothetical protein [Candidatus Nanoarchaeia archaeon]MDD5054619.1 hypothetical protein [Candidatus Nanoarchaeia archaeon]MDD5499440.1 hypothetical protein [Candidatus Nanoarchaeia archaeon]
MNDLSDAYGLLFTGLVIVFLFISCYKIILNSGEAISQQLSSDYLACNYKSDFGAFNLSADYSKTFALPKYNVFENKIVEVIIYE